MKKIIKKIIKLIVKILYNVSVYSIILSLIGIVLGLIGIPIYYMLPKLGDISEPISLIVLSTCVFIASTVFLSLLVEYIKYTEKNNLGSNTIINEMIEIRKKVRR